MHCSLGHPSTSTDQTTSPFPEHNTWPCRYTRPVNQHNIRAIVAAGFHAWWGQGEMALGRSVPDSCHWAVNDL